MTKSEIKESLVNLEDGVTLSTKENFNIIHWLIKNAEFQEIVSHPLETDVRVLIGDVEKTYRFKWQTVQLMSQARNTIANKMYC